MIEFKNISKSFGPHQVLSDISFKVSAGEVLALIGENGAGKSTVMNIFFGLVQAGAGTMTLRGDQYAPQSPEDAFRHKIGFVHQHFQLADELTGFEHIELLKSSQVLKNKNLLALSKEIIVKYGWDLDLSLKIKELSVSEQQKLEILKVLLLEPEIIIFDEPTAVLNPKEVEDFLNLMKNLKKQGHTQIMITHKLKEVMSISDQVCILRRGELVLNQKTQDVDLDTLAKEMLGEHTKVSAPTSETVLIKNEPSSHQENRTNDKRPKKLNLYSTKLTIQSGEITAVVGVQGNGQSEFIKSILSDVKNQNYKFADISEDRYRYSIYPQKTLLENFVIRHREVFFNSWGLEKNVNLQEIQSLLDQWDVRPREIHQKMGDFSGGNQQKFVVGRELWSHPDFILAAYPTRGVDLGAQKLIHEALIKEKNKNKWIVLVSADLEEVFKLADKVIVLFKGEAKGPFALSELVQEGDESRLGKLMNGVDV